VATFNGLTLDAAGNYHFTVQGAGLSAISPGFVVNPATASQLLFAALLPDTSAGQELPAVQVLVRDQFGNPVTGTRVTLAANGPGTLSGITPTALSQNGSATFNSQVLTTAGPYVLDASAGSLSATSTGFTVHPGAASQVAFVTGAGNTPAGQSLPTVQVALQDAYGNLATDAAALVTLTATGPATVSATATTAQGIATFTGVTLTTAGTYTLSASAPGVFQTQAPAFSVTPAAATELAFEANPPGATAGVALPNLRIDLRDAFGNLVPSAAGTVTISVAGPGGFTAGAVTAPAAAGVAVFTGLTLQKSGSYVLTVTAPNLASASSAPFTIAPAAASQLAFEPLPNSGTAGSALPDLRVDVLDSFGNLTTSKATLQLAILGPSLPVAGSTNQTAVSGVADFSGLILQKVGAYNFNVSGPGLLGASAGPVTIAPAAANHLAFASTPVVGAAGQTLPDVTIDVLDAYGNLSTSAEPVTLAVSSPRGFSTGTTTSIAVNGVARFAGLVLPSGGGYTLFANAPGLAPPAPTSLSATGPAATTTSTTSTTTTSTNPITITAASIPARIRFISVPHTGRAGKPLAAFRLQVLDASGHPVANKLVRLHITSGKLRGILQRTTNSTGTVTFTSLSIPRSGRYTILASVSGLTTTFAIRVSISAT
jgi:hypothetical protein